MKAFAGFKIKDLLLIALGTTLLAMGIAWFASPSGLVAGGVSGTAIILKALTTQFYGGIPLWFTNIALNIPLFVISILQRGFSFAHKSLYSVLWLSLALWFFEKIPNLFYVGDDLFLCSVMSGALAGLGIGIVLHTSSTTGGTDMLASIIKCKRPYLPIAHLILIIDVIVITSGWFLFGTEKTMYAVLSIFISTYVTNSILEGIRFAKVAFIISDKTPEISKAIFDNLSRGNTALKARGMYTQTEKEVLFVVVSPKEIATLRSIVKQTDPKAFITIADVKETLGEGFIENFDPMAIT